MAELEHPRTTGPAHHIVSTSHTANAVLTNPLSSSTAPTCLSSYSTNYISSLSTTSGLVGTTNGNGLASVLSAGTTIGGITSSSGSALGITSLSGATGILGTSSALGATGLGKSGLERATGGTMGGGVTSSFSSHALSSHYGDALGGLGGTLSGAGPLGGVSISTANVSPLPMRAHHMNTMPPMCQV